MSARNEYKFLKQMRSMLILYSQSLNLGLSARIPEHPIIRNATKVFNIIFMSFNTETALCFLNYPENRPMFFCF